MQILVTGGAGFIGSNFVRHLLAHYPDYGIVNLDKLTYAGNLENLAPIWDVPRHRFVHGDIADASLVENILKQGFDAVVNFAAESHVDRSIIDSQPFIQTNVVGTLTLLEAARRHRVGRFLQVSTDEVYGSLSSGVSAEENSPLSPSSPYAASKAAADHLALAYYRTFGLPVLIARSSNNYGPYQFPEKLIPLVVTNALADLPLPVYGDGKQIRDWLYVEDNCQALTAIMVSGSPGEVYNVGSECHKTNLEVIESILSRLGKPRSLINYVADRPGHDRRYALDCAKIRRELGWQRRIPFEAGIEMTIDWYLKNRKWWQKIKEGTYQEYYRQQYGVRLPFRVNSSA